MALTKCLLNYSLNSSVDKENSKNNKNSVFIQIPSLTPNTFGVIPDLSLIPQPYFQKSKVESPTSQNAQICAKG